jgi:hypothetical protein
MNQRRRLLFTAIIFSIATAAPLSSFAFAQECDGNYYAGIGTNQHYSGNKRPPANAYLLKRKASQRELQRATATLENREPS